MKLDWELNAKMVKILQDLATGARVAATSDESKLKTLFQTCLAADSDRTIPVRLQSLIADIDAISDKSEFLKRLGPLQKNGVGLLFNVGIVPDSKDAHHTLIVQFSQGGLSGPARDYYLGDNAKVFTGPFLQYVAKVLGAFHASGDAEADARRVLELESSLAAAWVPASALVDPEKSYHKVAFGALQSLIPLLDIGLYLRGSGVSVPSEVLVVTPDYFPALNIIIEALPLESLKAYAKFRAVTSLSVNPQMREMKDEFDRVFSGQKQRIPVERVCAVAVNSIMPDAISKEYLMLYSDSGTKSKATALIQAIEMELAKALKSIPLVR